MRQDRYSFRTITQPSEGIYREKGSRFLAFAFPVASEVEIRNHILFLRKKYFDARHHCYAWMLGADKELFRAFDDGEPNHSAGDPILGQIRSRDLTNVLVVVVRYFGGVKLGVGGLISAYKSATEDALNQANVVEKEVTDKINIVYDYSATPEVMRLVKDLSLVICSQRFDNDCRLEAEYSVRDRQKLFEKLNLLQATGTNVRYDQDPGTNSTALPG